MAKQKQAAYLKAGSRFTRRSVTFPQSWVLAGSDDAYMTPRRSSSCHDQRSIFSSNALGLIGFGR
jgi:hypothetical protein